MKMATPMPGMMSVFMCVSLVKCQVGGRDRRGESEAEDGDPHRVDDSIGRPVHDSIISPRGGIYTGSLHDDRFDIQVAGHLR